MSEKNIQALLTRLNIAEMNPGVCTGPDDWTDSGAPPITSYNPSTGEALAQVIPSTADTYDSLVRTAQDAFSTWRETPAPRRGLVVRDLGIAVRESLEPLGELITLEMGKIRAEGIGEVQEMIDICDFATGLSRQLYGLTMHSERPKHRMYEQWHPLGPIGVITAFNFPIAVWSWNATLAAVCGDTIIWKPSELTPLTAVALQHIANRVMADYGLSGIFNLAAGGPDIGRLMAGDARLPLVSFTGSTKVGRTVAQTVAGRLGRTILELGGNNAIVVAADADLELATRGILFGAVGTAGQRCTSTRRIIAHRAIVDQLADRLVRAYQHIPVGDPLDEGTLLGPLVTSAAVEHMEAAVRQAVAEGGEVLTGGHTLPTVGPQFIEPTIIRMPTQTEIVRQETFAPILYILEYDKLEEAMRLHNDVPQGLSSAIFTDSLRTAENFLASTGSDCGIANVNIGTSGAEIGGAFGGEKETGGGRESGSDAWKGYMRRQTNTINWSKELPLAQGIRFES
ncbi:MAG: aldehyde dehydrogenase family protein [Anaerolineales bacterium]|uniref:L-piperidine-6-carboxylate dehydrogenase n=1 Tax=Promineifilum sp. TaxID=2664178 RepID=UPI001D9FB420|nr:aldehyde dehydrogenase family protein [Anaerolineales bacterium]MCB8934629.1 aldehyde dehydrogenase family protein [Promineifilum sp.]MCO5180855.1 aldehyde dehydrogenase family protein [Promineifilum sp.]